MWIMKVPIGAALRQSKYEQKEKRKESYKLEVTDKREL